MNAFAPKKHELVIGSFFPLFSGLSCLLVLLTQLLSAQSAGANQESPSTGEVQSERSIRKDKLVKRVKVVASEVVIGHNLALKLTAKGYLLDFQYEKDFQTDVR